MRLYVLDVFKERFPNCGVLFSHRIITRQRAKLDRERARLERELKNQPHRIKTYMAELEPLDMKAFERVLGSEDIWDVVNTTALD